MAAAISLSDIYAILFYLTAAICVLAGAFIYKVNSSALFSIAAGAFSDVIFRQSFQEIRPQLGVLYALVPVSAVLYSVRVHGIMNMNHNANFYWPGHVLSREKRISVYNLLAFIFITGSFIYFVLDYVIMGSPVNIVILLSFYILVLGVFILNLPYQKSKERTQDFQLGLVMAILTPILTLSLYRVDYNRVIWALPIVLMIISTVFYTRSILVSIFVSAVLFESILYFSKLPFYEHFFINDYIQRIALYSITAGLVNFISILYKQRLTENERQNKLQQQLSLISSEFIDVDNSTINSKLDNMLQSSGLYFNMDRACLYIDDDNNNMKISNYWCRQDHLTRQIEMIHYDLFKWIKNELYSEQFIYYASIADMPAKAAETVLAGNERSL